MAEVKTKPMQESSKRMTAGDVDMTIGTITRYDYAAPKTSGVKIRGTGAATKGKMARGPMA